MKNITKKIVLSSMMTTSLLGGVGNLVATSLQTPKVTAASSYYPELYYSHIIKGKTNTELTLSDNLPKDSTTVTIEKGHPVYSVKDIKSGEWSHFYFDIRTNKDNQKIYLVGELPENTVDYDTKKAQVLSRDTSPTGATSLRSKLKGLDWKVIIDEKDTSTEIETKPEENSDISTQTEPSEGQTEFSQTENTKTDDNSTQTDILDEKKDVVDSSIQTENKVDTKKEVTKVLYKTKTISREYNLNQVASTKIRTKLYSFDKNNSFIKIPGKYLEKNTNWFSDQKITVDGKTYVRVATNEWILSNDCTIKNITK